MGISHYYIDLQAKEYSSPGIKGLFLKVDSVALYASEVPSPQTLSSSGSALKISRHFPTQNSELQYHS